QYFLNHDFSRSENGKRVKASFSNNRTCGGRNDRAGQRAGARGVAAPARGRAPNWRASLGEAAQSRTAGAGRAGEAVRPAGRACDAIPWTATPASEMTTSDAPRDAKSSSPRRAVA